jgi:hypothetical protein
MFKNSSLLRHVSYFCILIMTEKVWRYWQRNKVFCSTCIIFFEHINRDSSVSQFFISISYVFDSRLFWLICLSLLTFFSRLLFHVVTWCSRFLQLPSCVWVLGFLWSTWKSFSYYECVCTFLLIWYSCHTRIVDNAFKFVFSISW